MAYIARLEQSKFNADQTVRQAIISIEQDIRGAAATLLSAQQKVPFDLNEMVEALNEAKREWLQHMSSVFDSAILTLKQRLEQSPPF